MYAARDEWKLANPDKKFVSFYNLYNSCKPPQNWLEIAERCSNNPNHEHFGKSPETILEIWNTKKNQGQVRGNSVDDFMKSLITGEPYDSTGDDEIFVNKSKNIKHFYDNVLSKAKSYIGDEVWLTSSKLGVSVRCDGLFELQNGSILIGEWKNITKYSTYNKYSKLLGPLTGYDDCDMFQNNLQVYLYKYILEEHGYDNIKVLIVNFEENQHRPIKTLLDDNYKELIENLVKHYNESES